MTLLQEAGRVLANSMALQPVLGLRPAPALMCATLTLHMIRIQCPLATGLELLLLSRTRFLLQTGALLPTGPHISVLL